MISWNWFKKERNFSSFFYHSSYKDFYFFLNPLFLTPFFSSLNSTGLVFSFFFFFFDELKQKYLTSWIKIKKSKIGHSLVLIQNTHCVFFFFLVRKHGNNQFLNLKEKPSPFRLFFYSHAWYCWLLELLSANWITLKNFLFLWFLKNFPIFLYDFSSKVVFVISLLFYLSFFKWLTKKKKHSKFIFLKHVLFFLYN